MKRVSWTLKETWVLVSLAQGHGTTGTPWWLMVVTVKQASAGGLSCSEFWLSGDSTLELRMGVISYDLIISFLRLFAVFRQELGRERSRKTCSKGPKVRNRTPDGSVED
ncbi:hypothetical protein ILYODFUR_009555 [Ilyodon furcidens]|uniref:Uncharacterized protein n=1 Tax=Ilyodon furcidens TaxID=33524 RepID=A0ABV0TW73_9TELE